MIYYVLGFIRYIVLYKRTITTSPLYSKCASQCIASCWTFFENTVGILLGHIFGWQKGTINIFPAGE